MAKTPKQKHQSKTKTASKGVKDSYTGYCVKCKESRTFSGEVTESTKGARTTRMAKGPCEKCGTVVCRILGKAS